MLGLKRSRYKLGRALSTYLRPIFIQTFIRRYSFPTVARRISPLIIRKLNSATASEYLCKTHHDMHNVLNITLFYPGTAGDSFTSHLGAPFSTKDRDNDYASGKHCAKMSKGGWWYTQCRESNLNSLYHNGSHNSQADGINWNQWKGDNYSAMRSEMKIRPADF